VPADPVSGDILPTEPMINASGTTSGFEFARYFLGNLENKRSIIFALFSAEEKGFWDPSI